MEALGHHGRFDPGPAGGVHEVHPGGAGCESEGDCRDQTAEAVGPRPQTETAHPEITSKLAGRGAVRYPSTPSNRPPTGHHPTRGSRTSESPVAGPFCRLLRSRAPARPAADVEAVDGGDGGAEADPVRCGSCGPPDLEG